MEAEHFENLGPVSGRGKVRGKTPGVYVTQSIPDSSPDLGHVPSTCPEMAKKTGRVVDIGAYVALPSLPYVRPPAALRLCTQVEPPVRVGLGVWAKEKHHTKGQITQSSLAHLSVMLHTGPTGSRRWSRLAVGCHYPSCWMQGKARQGKRVLAYVIVKEMTLVYPVNISR